jgi:aspartokinase-like uncharacterized kinase
VPDAPVVDAVVKLGGSLLRDPAAHAVALGAVADAASAYRLAIVPGGGPFADAVRILDHSTSLGNDVAHWLAIHAMDMHAELIAARLPHAALVESADAAATMVALGRTPVVVLSRWMQALDPLPHSWDVTSDSIAAWVAGALAAPRLVLLKPVPGDARALADAYFQGALPAGVRAVAIGVAELASGRLRHELSTIALA